ncbi:MAG: hypothetical protein PHQ76_07325, partial [Caldisericia bacterium]|nr:hypothetical protein [Caldisericia bacterium]
QALLGARILLIILYFYNPDENDVEICNTATAEGDDIKLLEHARKDPFTYIRDGEYHECDLFRPDIPARDSSGEQIDSKGVLELLYEITADIKDQIPNGEFVRLNAVPCPEEEDESANDFSDVGGLDCDEDGKIDIPIDNPYNEEP